MAGKTSFLKRWVLSFVETEVKREVNKTVSVLKNDMMTIKDRNDVKNDDQLYIIRLRGYLTGMLGILSSLFYRLDNEGLSSQELLAEIEAMRKKSLDACVDYDYLF